MRDTERERKVVMTKAKFEKPKYKGEVGKKPRAQNP